MSASDITIGKYLELKGGTIEELLQYAQSKGINLPEDLNYCFTPTELKTIDPTMAYRLKFSRALSSTNETVKVHVSEDASPNMHLTNEDTKTDDNSLKILGRIDLDAINQSTRPSRIEKSELSGEANSSSPKTEGKKKSPKRLIGVVKFNAN